MSIASDMRDLQHTPTTETILTQRLTHLLTCLLSGSLTHSLTHSLTQDLHTTATELSKELAVIKKEVHVSQVPVTEHQCGDPPHRLICVCLIASLHSPICTLIDVSRCVPTRPCLSRATPCQPNSSESTPSSGDKCGVGALVGMWVYVNDCADGRASWFHTTLVLVH